MNEIEQTERVILWALLRAFPEHHGHLVEDPLYGFGDFLSGRRMASPGHSWPLAGVQQVVDEGSSSI